MPRLKVFRTAIGFHDAYVAATSRKAALAAWGSDKDLFARGAAEEVADPALAAEALAAPGTVIRRLRGTIVEVACWAHVRRKIYDVWKATGSTTARTGVSMIDLMYEAEDLGRVLPREDRLERRQVVRVGVDGFFKAFI